VGNLATQILSVQLVLANGTLAAYRSGEPELKGVACGLGAFGVITEIELQLEPAFNVTDYAFLKYGEFWPFILEIY
jgi:xylitol oxidase